MDQICDERRQPVIIAKGSLQLRDAQRVVFVDDRDRAELQQCVQRVTDVQVLCSMLKIIGRKQYLGSMKAEFFEEMIVRLDERTLPNSSDGLELGEVFRTARQTEASNAGTNRTGADQHHTKPLRTRLCKLVRERFDLRFAQMSARVGQNTCSDFYDDGGRLSENFLT